MHELRKRRSRSVVKRSAEVLGGILAMSVVATATVAQAPASAPQPAAPQPAASAPAPAQPAFSVPAVPQPAASAAAPIAPPPPAAANPQPASSSASPAERGAASAIAATLPRDLSPWGMFLNADIFVKAVMLGLLFASLVTWTVFVAKNWEMWTATRKGRAALAALHEARSLADANARLGAGSEPVAGLLRTAVQE